jgi:hypothetical protein
MHRSIAMTLFTRDDIHYAHHAELQLLYTILKKTKVAPVKEMFNHWIDTIKASTPIPCTSLVTRLAASIDALDGQNMIYITTPRIKVDEHFLMQGHHLKNDNKENLVFYFLGCTNDIPLPNPDLHLYKSTVLTFILVEQEEALRSSASLRSTRSSSQ